MSHLPIPCVPGRVLFDLIAALPPAITQQVQAVAFDGTSSTALLVDAASGRVLAAPKLYDEAQGPAAVQAAKVGSSNVQLRPERSGVSCTIVQTQNLLNEFHLRNCTLPRQPVSAGPASQGQLHSAQLRLAQLEVEAAGKPQPYQHSIFKMAPPK